ncbi:MAG TPA: hypothetical protein VF322_09790 [Gammaproteobacteria bacterium]
MKRVSILVLLVAGPAGAMAQSCEPEGDLRFVCGLNAVEDLVQVGDSRWLLGSGLGGGGNPGTLVLVDSEAKTGEVIYPAEGAAAAHARERFPGCASPPDASVFNAHGITLRATGPGRYEFLVVNHGGREAVEFFDVDARGAKPALTWIGCVTMPPDTSINSLDTLPDGGFVVTHFYTPSKGGMGAVFDGEITGGLLEWHPGGEVTPIPGTELSGANGVALSDGGRVIHVAAWGTRDLVRFERRGGAVTKRAVPVDFALDNIRWTADGNLLIAGQKFVPRREGPERLDGWTVAVYDPDSLELVAKLKEVDGTAAFQGVSSALEVGDTIWVGPFQGDRIAYFPSPRR